MVQTEVRVGVACFVFYRDSEGTSRILVSQRKGSHGAGTWQLPGGHLTCLNLLKMCAAFLTAMNNIMGEKHYVTIFMCSEISAEETKDVRVMEPYKVEGEWTWLTLEELKDHNPKFIPLQGFLDSQDLSFLN
ncbi:unnamed protein product [Rhizopus stolonifer]